MSDYKKKIIELIESEISGYKIYKDTGVSQGRISDLRNGKREIDGISLDTAERLYEYAKTHLK